MSQTTVTHCDLCAHLIGYYQGAHLDIQEKGPDYKRLSNINLAHIDLCAECWETVAETIKQMKIPRPATENK